MSEPELTPEQLIEQIKQLKVADLVLSTVTTLAQLAYAKLEEQSRDLDQARLAIDTIGVLLPKLEGHIPADLSRDLVSMHANLQLAYADAASEKPVE
ncbi:MAG TPA: hypothetical protein VFP31_06855 [Gaiellaceae bacterium]|nr:hypothetical protein [Gaiellaceae bacterium]